MLTSPESGDLRPLRNILDYTFRANPHYKLQLIEKLPPAEQEMLAAMEEDDDFYGLLYPETDSNLGIKAIDVETALLFYTLQEPGTIPRYVRRRFGTEFNEAIYALVLEGVLELAPAGSGNFVSGAAAYERLYTRPEPGVTTHEQVDRLSQEALTYAQSLAITSRHALSSRLYHYNTVPVSAAWRCSLPDRQAVSRYLGILSGGTVFSHLARHWVAADNDENEGWLLWQRRAPHSKSPIRYKLYVSPAPEALPDVWPAIVEAFTAGSARAFKIGATVYGLLRPDKIVAYCTSFEALTETAAHLKTALPGCPAQGVPFTAAIDSAGLFSWGMDPPAAADIFGWQGRESWRLWITNRLAVALLDAKAQQSDLPPWRFAIERLRLEGVDTKKWAPSQTMWQEPRSS